jgi:calcineurin-like phosphoesterase family protein
MKRFWTADWHLGSPGIIEYCARPFKDVQHMNKMLIHNANQRVKKGDMLVSVGDMLIYGRAKGIEGLRLKYADYVSQINGTFINIDGNHDLNNRVKSLCNFMVTTIGQYTFTVSHKPSDRLYDDTGIDVRTFYRSVHLCGHVHTRWKHEWIEGILNINVGCDQWNYMPVSDDEIMKYITTRKLI